MIKNKICRISNCNNIIRGKGTVCGKHKWRFNKYKSYDLPSYIGTPNYYIKNELPKDIVKICDIHGQLKTTDTYIRHYKGKISSYYCKKCILDGNIKRKYKGLNSLKCYEELLQKQNGLCAICNKTNTTTRNGKIKRYAIDHCHKSGKVRGLLCGFCNSALGYFKDKIELLKKAIAYIEDNK